MTGVEEAAPVVAGAAGAGATAGMTAAEWAALIASLGGTAASIYGQQEAADQRKTVLENQNQRTQQAEDKSAKLVDQEGTSYQGDARAAALTAQQNANVAQSQQDLGSAPTIIDGAGDAGNVSSDYLHAKADTAISEGNRLTALARELAKTRAPGQLQESEALRRASLAGDLNSMWSSTKNDARAAQDDASDIGEPVYGQLGKLASAAGSAYLSSSGGARGRSGNGTSYSLTDAQLGDNAQQPSIWNTSGSRAGRVKLGG